MKDRKSRGLLPAPLHPCAAVIALTVAAEPAVGDDGCKTGEGEAGPATGEWKGDMQLAYGMTGSGNMTGDGNLRDNPCE